MSQRRPPPPSGNSPPPPRHGSSQWEDPYANAAYDDATGTEDNTTDFGADAQYFGGDALVRPMGSLWSATRPGAQQVNRPAITSHHPSQPNTAPPQAPSTLMYAPRQQPQQYPPYESQQQQAMHSSIPAMSASAPHPSQQRYHQSLPATSTVASYPGASPYQSDGVGVGVMVDSRGNPTKENATHDAEEQHYQQQQQRYNPQSIPPPDPYQGMQQQQQQQQYPPPPPPSQRQHAQPPPPPQHQTIPLPNFNTKSPPLEHYSPLEPTAPKPQKSKRYLKTSKRFADIAPGELCTTKSAPKFYLFVICESCRAPCQVHKSSVLMKCHRCKHVCAATPPKLKNAPMH